MALLALVLGVFGAVYFERGNGGSVPQVARTEVPPASPSNQTAHASEAAPPPTAAPSENKPQEQAAAPHESNAESPPLLSAQTAQAIPTPAEPPPAQALPQIQASNPPPSPDSEAQRLAQISPSAAPTRVAAATPGYWVEFGIYERGFYAGLLKQRLAQLGIAATVTAAHGTHGRRYLRVRTSGDSDRATALAQRTKARSALHIAPLVHRAAVVGPVPARAPQTDAKPGSSGRYWVQFGVFRERQNAEQMLSHLRRGDVQASVIEGKNGTLKPLYLIRVSNLTDRAQAEKIVQQGNDALHSHDALIGRSSTAPGLHRRPPPR